MEDEMAILIRLYDGALAQAEGISGGARKRKELLLEFAEDVKKKFGQTTQTTRMPTMLRVSDLTTEAFGNYITVLNYDDGTFYRRVFRGIRQNHSDNKDYPFVLLLQDEAYEDFHTFEMPAKLNDVCMVEV